MPVEVKYTVILAKECEDIGIQKDGVNQVEVVGSDLSFITESGSLHVSEGGHITYILAPGMWQGVRREWTQRDLRRMTRM